MPESELANFALGVLVLGGHLLFVVGAYQFGLRVGRDRQRVLSSRLGHGLCSAPSALLSDPVDVSPNQKRRDLGGFSQIATQPKNGDPVSGSRSLPEVSEVTR